MFRHAEPVPCEFPSAVNRSHIQSLQLLSLEDRSSFMWEIQGQLTQVVKLIFWADPLDLWNSQRLALFIFIFIYLFFKLFQQTTPNGNDFWHP